MSKLSDEDYRSIPLNATLALAALVVIIAGMKVGADLLVPLLLAVFIVVVCTSPVQWLHRCGLSRRMSALITLLVLVGFISLIGLLVVNSFSTFVEALPDIETRLYEHYWDLLNALASHGLAIDPTSSVRCLPWRRTAPGWPHCWVRLARCLCRAVSSRCW